MTGGKPKTNRYLEEMRDALDACGLPWRVEPGLKHDKVFIGVEMAFVIPRGQFKDRAPFQRARNARSIRRAVERQAK